jgi:hypothetical protein
LRLLNLYFSKLQIYLSEPQSEGFGSIIVLNEENLERIFDALRNGKQDKTFWLVIGFSALFVYFPMLLDVIYLEVPLIKQRKQRVLWELNVLDIWFYIKLLDQFWNFFGPFEVVLVKVELFVGYNSH